MTVVQFNAKGEMTVNFDGAEGVSMAHAPAGANHDHVAKQLAALQAANLGVAQVGHRHGQAANDTPMPQGATLYQMPHGPIASAHAQGEITGKSLQQAAAMAQMNTALMQPQQAQSAAADWASRVSAPATGTYAGRA